MAFVGSSGNASFGDRCHKNDGGRKTKRDSWLSAAGESSRAGQCLLLLLVDADVVDFQLAYQGLTREDRTPIALPGIIDHHVQYQLHRPIFDGGRVAVEPAALHAVDVPRYVGWPPIEPEPHEVSGIVFDLTGAIVV